MRTLAVIQARMGSTRLPGKVMKRLANHPALFWCYTRVKNARTVDEVIVATSHLSQDNPIAEFCQLNHWPCYRGSETDVLDRFYQSARPYQPLGVVRITADCPLIDPDLIDLVVSAFYARTPSVDYLSNVHPRTFPRGLDVEVASFCAIERAWRAAEDPYSREHVTPYLYQHPELFRLASITNTEDLSGLRWTLDTMEDYQLINSLCEVIDVTSPWSEILVRN